MFELIHRYV